MTDEVIIKAAMNIKGDALDLFELMYMNNPNSFVNALRIEKHTAMIKPDNKEIEKIIKRYIAKSDVSTLQNIIKHVAYNPQNPNFSTNALLWENIGVTAGDFMQVFNNIVERQKGNSEVTE